MRSPQSQRFLPRREVCKSVREFGHSARFILRVLDPDYFGRNLGVWRLGKGMTVKLFRPVGLLSTQISP
jgi:hypothetical protein